jgi:hypothetical protein
MYDDHGILVGQEELITLAGYYGFDPTFAVNIFGFCRGWFSQRSEVRSTSVLKTEQGKAHQRTFGFKDERQFARTTSLQPTVSNGKKKQRWFWANRPQ